MKTLQVRFLNRNACGIFILLGSAGWLGAASVVAAQQGVAPPSTAYSIVSRDANSRVWERKTSETLPSGEKSRQVHRYIELAPGMNYQRGGEWVESREQINLLPDGSAAAVQGQHQAYFPPDIYRGVIEVVTPDGKQLRSRPLGLNYCDGSKNVMIGELKHSVGKLAGPNQVIYPDAFTGVKADLRYTYRKDGFEQDIILREKPPEPERYGLKATQARLQMLTEFFNAPEPGKQVRSVNKQNGLSDTTLKFGAMEMAPGKAFAMADRASGRKAQGRSSGVPVYKSWERINGRSVLVEELPLQTINAQLRSLPASKSTMLAASSGNSVLHKVSFTRLLPEARPVEGRDNAMQLAKADFNQESGVVLDYVMLDSDVTNFTFQSDTTYYVSTSINLFGVTTFEGGTVIKFADETGLAVGYDAPPVCQTSAYRPAVFTSKNDDTVGEVIDGSTGSPGTVADAIYIDDVWPSFNGVDSPEVFQGLRFSYAGDYAYNSDWGDMPITFRDCQFIKCGDAISFNASQIILDNDLFVQCDTVLDINYSQILAGCQLTVDNCANLIEGSGTGGITNSIVTRTGSTNGITFYDSLVTNNATGIYQSVVAGNYYLANSSPYRNAGTTNIDSSLLAELRQKTTYPPVVYSSTTFYSDTTLDTQVQRDTNAPDLGYHYDPLDYAVSEVSVSSSSLTFGVGVAVGWYGSYGFESPDSANLIFNGTASAPDYLVAANTLQEEPLSCGNGIALDPDSGSVDPQPFAAIVLYATFTRFSYLGQLTTADDLVFNPITFQMTSCEMWAGSLSVPTIYVDVNESCTNCLLDRCYLTGDGPNLTLQNCTMHGGSVILGTGDWTIVSDTAFDGTTIYIPYSVTSDYNAFQGSAGLPGDHNVVVSDFDWQVGPLGNYYLPSGSPLIDVGSTTADLVGLYYFTTQTSQVLETNSVVDIGYHHAVN